MRIDADLDDSNDLDNLQDSYLSEVFEDAKDSRLGLHHVFLGLKVRVTDTVFFIPEVSWIFGDADGVGSIGLSVGFRLP